MIVQRKGNNLAPFSEKDLDELREIYENQPVEIKIKTLSAAKIRSKKQLDKYWAVCTLVAENNEHPDWQKKNDVDFNVRMALRFFKKVVVANDGSTWFEPRSIAMKNMKHIEANDYFDRAFHVMADFLGIEKEELLRNA